MISRRWRFASALSNSLARSAVTCMVRTSIFILAYLRWSVYKVKLHGRPDWLWAADKGNVMNVDRAVFAFAGTILLVSLALAWLLSPYWLLLSAFVGLNLLQSAFTGFCPAAILFRKLGLKPGCAFASEVSSEFPSAAW